MRSLVGLVTLLLFATALPLRAERLPLRAYSTADGLPHDEVRRVFADTRGFLWFCTAGGLSRFDGYTFTNFGIEQGLPEGGVNDFLETRAGDFWIATDGGLIQFDPNGGGPQSTRPMFKLVRSTYEDRFARTINVLREGRDGTIWAGTGKGLYRLERAGGAPSLVAVEVGLPSGLHELRDITDVLEDHFGTLWLVTVASLTRRWPDGSAATYTRNFPHENVATFNGNGLLPRLTPTCLYEDRDGHFWMGTRESGIVGFTADASHAVPAFGVAFSMKDGLPHPRVYQLFETSDRRLWVATAAGFAEFFPHGDSEGRHLRPYTVRNGLIHQFVRSLSEDRGGNLWLSTNAGAMRLAHEGFTTYGRLDGISSVNTIFEDRAGDICFRGYVLGEAGRSVFEGAKLDLTGGEPELMTRVGCFDGRRFDWFDIDAAKWGWVLEGITLQTRDGEFWIGTGAGVLRFAASDHFVDVKKARPVAVYGTQDGLANAEVARMFEDSAGDIWVVTVGYPTNGLARWERATGRLHDLRDMPGMPSLTNDVPHSFGEDAVGNVWIGLNAGLVRYTRGTFTYFPAGDSLPRGTILDIHLDRSGRLWLATDRAGLVRVDHTEAAKPIFTSITTAQGLSANGLTAIAEDAEGFLYVGSGQGIDRFDPGTGHVRHYTAADGLTPALLRAAYRDRHGVLWFGTTNGLARFAPPAARTPAAPMALISGVRVMGAARDVSALGERTFALHDLAPDQNQLQIDFVGLGSGAGETLRYQYDLNAAGWSAPGVLRTVNFAGLTPGQYTLLVRAVTSDGETSDPPASITFRILPPIWRRWWALTIIALAAGALIFSFYRYRLARALEIASMRARIATDLHDDIGANLTRIAMLSEVAKRTNDQTSLTSIARIARESVGAMSDIVWAVNPKRESLTDLVRRMRQHADEVFTLRGIDLKFNPPDTDHARLSMHVRRDVLLIFKEAVNNAARHSNASRVSIDLSLTGGHLLMTIADNGQGFDTSRESQGHGLASLRRRAEGLKGTLEIESNPTNGTRVTLWVPLPRGSTPPVRVGDNLPGSD